MGTKCSLQWKPLAGNGDYLTQTVFLICFFFFQFGQSTQEATAALLQFWPFSLKYLGFYTLYSTFCLF